MGEPEHEIPDESVLIDTWWNVNNIYRNAITKVGCVLIDTWWNVNVNAITDNRYRGLSFNRYMVECECVFHLSMIFYCEF